MVKGGGVQEDDRIGVFVLRAFRALFRQDPRLLELFPYKDERGRPVEAELRALGKTVVRLFGELLQGLNDFPGTARFLKGLVKCAAASVSAIAHALMMSAIPAHMCTCVAIRP